MHGKANCHEGDSNTYYDKHFNNCGHPKKRLMFIVNHLTGKQITNRTSLIFVKKNQNK